MARTHALTRLSDNLARSAARPRALSHIANAGGTARSEDKALRSTLSRREFILPTSIPPAIWHNQRPNLRRGLMYEWAAGFLACKPRVYLPVPFDDKARQSIPSNLPVPAPLAWPGTCRRTSSLALDAAAMRCDLLPSPAYAHYRLDGHSPNFQLWTPCQFPIFFFLKLVIYLFILSHLKQIILIREFKFCYKTSQNIVA